ncbi:polysaccharide biosynthesis/export family protein [Oleisolibacter albus]|uniref:polysaccharide biosynthesis/export family protein n=1 Tax=Oleisolibacter albus TaxID=2171757 RepID=UPI001EFD46FE|nr:polysaccharide biosynthesis/export family protein [Oleisolibacter albus]
MDASDLLSRRRTLMTGLGGTLSLLFLSAQAAADAVATGASASAPAGGPSDGASGGDAKSLYRLGAGDKLRIVVFGEDDLSGEFEVDSGGSLSLPLIGEIVAVAKTPRDLERDVAKALSDGYLVNPRVSIEVLNYRPFFILGEVKEPGKYPYVNGMTVLNAVAVAGGYTYRARKDQIVIVRGGDSGRETMAQEGSSVLPGDIIRVPERLF